MYPSSPEAAIDRIEAGPEEKRIALLACEHGRVVGVESFRLREWKASGSTPPGTYMISVQGSAATGQQHSVTVSLVVTP